METGSEQELINMHIKTEGYASEPSPLLKLFSIKFQSAWLPLGKNGFSDSKFISRSNLFSAPLIFSKVNGKKKKSLWFSRESDKIEVEEEKGRDTLYIGSSTSGNYR